MANKVPGLKGMEHIGFAVPDLEQATRFFVDVLGCEAFFDSGPISSDDDDFMPRKLGLHPRTVIRRMRHLRCGHGSNMELFEYQAPDQRMERPRNSDMGGHHLAFYSDDFDATLDWLRQNGVTVMGEPGEVMSGPNTGTRWVYFLSPWGMQMELVSYESGRAYEAATSRRLWHPSNPGA
jgi:catechol 2,3-dioxygenase-like lactoylglutathione lyase family enzyme